MTERIINDAVHHRYIITDEADELGYLTYTQRDDAVTVDSTVVHPQHRGKGIAGRLVKFALDDLAAATAKRIEPHCSYVVDYMSRHPEYGELTRRS